MQDVLELAYSPKRGIFLAISLAFGVAAVYLGDIAMTEEPTSANAGMLRIASAAAVLSIAMCLAFLLILFRSRNWRVRVDAHGVSVDTLTGRRSVAWAEMQSVELIESGPTRSLAVTGTKSTFALNSMLMSAPTEFDVLVDALNSRLSQSGHSIAKATLGGA